MLSVIIPCYNEETNIRNGVLHVVTEYLDRQTYEKEVIIVDDGSEDKSVELAEKFIQSSKVKYMQILRNPHGGKAATVITGLLAGKGDIVMFTDMDQATPIEELDKLLPYFDEGYDIVFGSRAGRREGAPLTRRILSTGHVILKNLIVNVSFEDTQCGFKAFRKDKISPLLNRLRIHGTRHAVKGGMVASGFDLEMLFVAKKMGYQIKEVPVEWHYVGTKRVNAIKDSWRGLKDMINLRINDIRGVYS
ncbi:MAG: glycosyltransferase [bacterium]|nr:glycosyltransferase [bacterium]